jgi:ribose transport system substrate-binding protein
MLSISMKSAALSWIVSVGALTTLVASAAADPLSDFNARTAQILKDATAKQTATPPKEGPKAVKGKKVVIIPCAMAAEGCARQARAAQEAAEALGWKVTLIDPAGDLAKAADTVQRAISIGAQGIIVISFDASALQGPLRRAKAEGIFVVAQAKNSDNIYDVTVPAGDFFVDQGYSLAAQQYATAGNKLRLIQLRGDEFGSPRERQQGTENFIKECKAAGGDCEILASENALVADLTTLVPKQAAALVQKHPDYNVFWTAYDAQLNFVVLGLQQADLLNSGFAIGFDANAANVAFIQQDKFEKGSLGLPLEWLGYGLADQLNRLFAGEKPVEDEGVRSRLLVKSNLPKSGAWEGDMDFRSAYKAVWGVE